MKHLAIFFVAVMALCGNAIAQESRQDSTRDNPLSSWQGYLVDAKSALELIKDPDTVMKNAAEYTKESALKDENRRSGYGIVTGGKWLKFDKAGNAQVAEFLKTSKQRKGIRVTVDGRLNGDELTVTSIKESVPDTSSESR